MQILAVGEDDNWSLRQCLRGARRSVFRVSSLFGLPAMLTITRDAWHPHLEDTCLNERGTMIPSDPSKIILYPTEAGESRRFDLGSVRWVAGSASWSHDGSEVVFTGTEPGKRPRVYLLDPTSGAIRAITPEETSGPLLTPDGQKVLVKGKSIDFSIYPVQGGEPEPTKGITDTDMPLRWDAVGRTIYVWDRTLPAKIYRLDPRTGKRELWLEINPPDPSGLLYGYISLSPDGQSYAYHFRRVLTNLFLAQNLR